MHGLGADGHDFEPIVPMLDTPQLRYIFPNAPEIPVTINAGFVMPAWYDIRTLEEGPHREDTDGILASAELIEALVQREVERGVSAGNIVMAGFSQGGAMALHVAVRFPTALRGIMIMSSYLVLPERLEAEAGEANRKTPALFCHGKHDGTVPCARGRAAHDALAALSSERPITWHDFPMQHEICPEEIAVVGAWLRQRFAA